MHKQNKNCHRNLPIYLEKINATIIVVYSSINSGTMQKSFWWNKKKLKYCKVRIVKDFQ